MNPYFWSISDKYDPDILSNKGIWDEAIIKKSKLTNRITYYDAYEEFRKIYHKKIEQELEELERTYFRELKQIPEEIITAKKTYLEGIFSLEKQRQINLDNKLVQLIAQNSIITAIIALMISLSNDKIDESDYVVFSFWIFVGLVFFAILFLVLSIINSISTLKPRGYLRPMHTLILNHGKSDLNNIHITQLESFYLSIKENIKVNTEKARQVNRNYDKFKIGLMLLVVSVFVFVFHRSRNEINSIKRVKIEQFESLTTIEEELSDISSRQITIKSSLDSFNYNLKNQTQEIIRLTSEIREVQITDTIANKNN